MPDNVKAAIIFDRTRLLVLSRFLVWIISIYRISPDEKVFKGTLGTLEETARENGITKTALIVVGGCLGETYERSKLYDPDFTTGYREGRS